MPFHSRFSSKRKDVRLLEERLTEAGLNVGRVEVYFDGKPGYYLMVPGDRSKATLKPAIAHQEFSGSPESILQQPNATQDRKICDIIMEEYKKSMPSFRNCGIGMVAALVYTIVGCIGMYFLPKDYLPTTSSALAMGAVLLTTAGVMIGIRSDNKRFDRNNRPWSYDELSGPYPAPVKKPYDNIGVLRVS